MPQRIRISAVVVLGILASITMFLLMRPPVVLAATCTATCSDGSRITVSSVYSCVAEDGAGVTYKQTATSQTQLKACPVN